MKKLQGLGGEECRDTLTEDACDLEMGKLKSDEESSLHEEEESLLVEGERLHREGGYVGHSMELPKVIVTSSRSIYRSSSERDTPARLATPDPDIQLAEPKRQVSLRSLAGSNGSPEGEGGLLTLCGPSPAKITTLCIVVLSVWVSWILLIHLSRRIGDLSSRLEESELSLRTLERDSQAWRSQSQLRVARLQNQLHQLQNNQKRRGANNPGFIRRAPPVPLPSQSVPIQKPSQSTTEGALLDIGIPSEPVQTMCTSSGEECILPFIFKGVSYSSCHQAWMDVKPWCPVKVNPDGSYISGDRSTWGYCQPCPTA